MEAAFDPEAEDARLSDRLRARATRSTICGLRERVRRTGRHHAEMVSS